MADLGRAVRVFWDLQTIPLPPCSGGVKTCSCTTVCQQLLRVVQRFGRVEGVTVVTSLLHEHVKSCIMKSAMELKETDADSVDRAILTDMLLWLSDKRPNPCIVVLITGEDYSYTVSRIKMRQLAHVVAITNDITSPLATISDTHMLFDQVLVGVQTSGPRPMRLDDPALALVREAKSLPKQQYPFMQSAGSRPILPTPQPRVSNASDDSSQFVLARGEAKSVQKLPYPSVHNLPQFAPRSGYSSPASNPTTAQSSPTFQPQMSPSPAPSPVSSSMFGQITNLKQTTSTFPSAKTISQPTQQPLKSPGSMFSWDSPVTVAHVQPRIPLTLPLPQSTNTIPTNSSAINTSPTAYTLTLPAKQTSTEYHAFPGPADAVFSRPAPPSYDTFGYSMDTTSKAGIDASFLSSPSLTAAMSTLSCNEPGMPQSRLSQGGELVGRRIVQILQKVYPKGILVSALKDSYVAAHGTSLEEDWAKTGQPPIKIKILLEELPDVEIQGNYPAATATYKPTGTINPQPGHDLSSSAQTFKRVSENVIKLLQARPEGIPPCDLKSAYHALYGVTMESEWAHRQNFQLKVRQFMEKIPGVRVIGNWTDSTARYVFCEPGLMLSR